MAVNVVLKSLWDGKGLNAAQSAFDKFGKSIGKIGGAIAAGLSVRALTEAARAAAEDAKSQALLAEQLRNTVGANEELIGSVEASIAKMQMNAAVADDVLRPAFAQLVRATGDVDQATRLMQIALDVSAATGRDVNSVTIALSKAYQGNTTALSRLGIKAQDGVDVFAMLEEQFAGAAETAARNDPFQRLTIIFGELEEQIGQMFLPYLNEIADYFASADFQSAFASMAASIGEAIKAIDRLFLQISGSTALTFFINLVDAAAVGLAEIAFVAGDAASTIGKIFTGDFAGAGKAMSTFMDRYNRFVQDIYKKQDEAKARAAKGGGGSAFVPTPPGTTTGKGGTTTKKETAAQKAAREQREGIEKARKIIADTAAKLTELQTENTAELAAINADYLDKVAETNKDFGKRLADIVQQSQDRLRDAYRNAVAVNISEIFGARTTQKITTEIKKIVGNIQTTILRETEETVGGSVDDLVAGLKDKLEKSRQLLANSAALASAGFSQTFIEQVVGAGTETGNELAKAILEATPETQKELSDLFKAVETESETGMDKLAKSIYEKAGLATTELKNLYNQTVIEQAEALKDLKDQLDKDLLETNQKFRDAVTKLKDQMLEDLATIKTDISELNAEIQALLDKMGELAGAKFTIPGIPETAAPVIPSVPKPAPTKPTTQVTVIAKADPTRSPAEYGRHISKVINKYTGGGGGVRTGFIAQ